MEDGEVTTGFASVAAAVVDHTGRPMAGLAVTFRSEAYDETGPQAGPRS